MADAVTIEREKTAELNKERATEETGGEEIKTSAKSTPNTGEYLIFLGIGAILDLSGLLSDLSLVFAIPLRIITIFPTLVFFLWRLMKGGKKIHPIGLAVMGGAETILSFLPAYTGFVVYAWLKELKTSQTSIGKLAKIKT